MGTLLVFMMVMTGCETKSKVNENVDVYKAVTYAATFKGKVGNIKVKVIFTDNTIEELSKVSKVDNLLITLYI